MMSDELVGVVYSGPFPRADVPLPSGATKTFQRDGDTVELSVEDATAVLTNEDFKPASDADAAKISAPAREADEPPAPPVPSATAGSLTAAKLGGTKPVAGGQTASPSGTQSTPSTPDTTTPNAGDKED